MGSRDSWWGSRMAPAPEMGSHNWHRCETDHISLVGNAKYEFLGQTKDRKESNPEYAIYRSIPTFALSTHTCRSRKSRIGSCCFCCFLFSFFCVAFVLREVCRNLGLHDKQGTGVDFVATHTLTPHHASACGACGKTPFARKPGRSQDRGAASGSDAIGGSCTKVS